MSDAWEDLGRELELELAHARKPRAAAADIAGRYADADLARLPLSTQTRLLESLADGWLWGKHRAVRDRIYAAIAPEPAYLVWQQAKVAELAAALKANSHIMDHRRHWSQMRRRDQLAVLQAVSDSAARIFGYKPPHLGWFSDSGKVRFADGHVEWLHTSAYDREWNMLNVNQWASYDDFDEALRWTVKAGATVQARALAKAHDDRQPPAGMEAAARLFAANLASGFHVSASDSIDGFLDQPVEKLARARGLALLKAMTAKPAPSSKLDPKP